MSVSPILVAATVYPVPVTLRDGRTVPVRPILIERLVAEANAR